MPKAARTSIRGTTVHFYQKGFIFLVDNFKTVNIYTYRSPRKITRAHSLKFNKRKHSLDNHSIQITILPTYSKMPFTLDDLRTSMVATSGSDCRGSGTPSDSSIFLCMFRLATLR